MQVDLPPLLAQLLVPPRLVLLLLRRVKQMLAWAWEHVPGLRLHPAPLREAKPAPAPIGEITSAPCVAAA